MNIVFQINFTNPGYSMLKTSVMMIGEFEFDDLFFGNPEENSNSSQLPFPIFSMIFFLAFMVVMPILIMNLLVRILYKRSSDNIVLNSLVLVLVMDIMKVDP